jgi:hypothetical protein
VCGNGPAPKVITVTEATRKYQSVNTFEVGSAVPEGNRGSTSKADGAERIAIIE